LKAMAKDPAGRYATAQELADDLKRFLEDKPVRARRPSLRERAAKWARRHKPLVWAAGLVLAVALVALAGSTWLIWRAQQDTLAALGKAREKQQLAQQVVSEMYAEVASQWLENEPRQEHLQRKFLLKALALYQRFAAEDGAEPWVRHEAAHAGK